MPDDHGLTIGAAAARTGCNVPTIRYYEEIGLLPKAGRTAGGRRVYGAPDLRRLSFIRRCREFGFPIEQVRALAVLAEHGDRDCDEALDLARCQLEAVRRKLAELKALERTLAVYVERCDTGCSGGPAARCVIMEDLAAAATTRCGS
jgi:DNA-binding transcriptional MerR regulator